MDSQNLDADSFLLQERSQHLQKAKRRFPPDSQSHHQNWHALRIMACSRHLKFHQTMQVWHNGLPCSQEEAPSCSVFTATTCTLLYRALQTCTDANLSSAHRLSSFCPLSHPEASPLQLNQKLLQSTRQQNLLLQMIQSSMPLLSQQKRRGLLRLMPLLHMMDLRLSNQACAF